MARGAVEVNIGNPLRDLKGRFAKANSKLLQIRREMLRPEAKRLVGLVKQEAPKKSGEFAKGISYRTFASGNATGFMVTTPQPLGRFLIEGTRPHSIIAKRASVLAFFWPNGPEGSGTYFYRSVHHPGTPPNRFHGRAYRRWLPGARRTLNRIGLRYVGELQ